MSSPSTFTTLISSAASTTAHDEPAFEHDSSDKAAIIGLTVVAGPSTAEEAGEERGRGAGVEDDHAEGDKCSGETFGGGLESPAHLTTPAIMSASPIFPRMSNLGTNILVAVLSAVLFVMFLSLILYCTWHSRPETPATNAARLRRARERSDLGSSVDTEVEIQPARTIFDDARDLRIIQEQYGLTSNGGMHPLEALPQARRGDGASTN
ncbi:hypothetical protein FSARC_2186 [Fusarium sarcochroum]|uniref:Uncharacterized protein n=1 Tax=Fusarium sarcochroum TaxID=1208366 RepID=A0A8H4XDY2_9HYPO|nr:hypothetical protein FSARC_2186 [Fusarium sarcochroum]